jgi:hypothetical protein
VSLCLINPTANIFRTNIAFYNEEEIMMVTIYLKKGWSIMIMLKFTSLMELFLIDKLMKFLQNSMGFMIRESVL